MVIKVRDEKEYIYKYLLALQGLMGFSPRELQVAAAMVYRYKIILRIKNNFKGEKARKAFNPMKELKNEKVLLAITKELNMSFPVFRNYVSGLKHKGFFDGGEISSVCIPGDKEEIIKFEYCE